MVRSRIAPTPSGYLHIGNLCSFIRTWLAVRQKQGKLLLRIDDIDNDRYRPEYLADIFDWLALLGLSYDEGPVSVADFEQHWSQQKRMAQYETILQRLAKTGAVYACNCSRKKIADLSEDGRYHGECRNKHLPLDLPGTVWRVHIPAQATVAWHDEISGMQEHHPAALMGDFVVRRKNGWPAYQVASLSDDLQYGINYIVRGADLLASTAAQLYLAQLLGENAFLQTSFAHHPLITDRDGAKLSKSAGSGALLQTHQQKDAAATWRLLQSCCDVVPGNRIIQTAADLLS
jgi:glutamyl-tRNA synthetase